MNIDEKIKELEEKLEEIKKENEELKKEKQTYNVRWRAENGCEYYFIDCNGDVLIDIETFDETDDFRYSVGNSFKTKEEAKIYKQNLLTYQQLKDIALRLNEGREIERHDFCDRKYYIYYDYELDKFDYSFDKECQNLNIVYCSDPNFLDVALKEIGEEKLKQLLEWGI